jgi:hypothetical protein
MVFRMGLGLAKFVGCASNHSGSNPDGVCLTGFSTARYRAWFHFDRHDRVQKTLTGLPNALMLRELLALVVDGPAERDAQFWARLQRVLALPVPGQICGGDQKSKSGGGREQRGENCPRNAVETSSVDDTLCVGLWASGAGWSLKPMLLRRGASLGVDLV